ncbi:MOSC domain-containing protein [Kushneria pakistanensis]|uniref:MOSC domain-containing protein n=1 Tax=Kushneria pakistanensis TaxID=1508770 RepID=A0ABQ3FP43_9GAMM|nr:MOSC N-terminal beta barrel domain-containing protein [Kushneria pakistanensis]GHC30968.1 MOSC domain-containing protein [Kushneria pakistanensis]
MTPCISSLHIYPVKSLAGIDLRESLLTAEGLAHDRRWVITDENGDFMTQRSCTRMATLIPAIDQHHLILEAPDGRHLFISLAPPEVAPSRVRIFGTECQGLDEGDEAAQWLSDFFERPVRLKRVPRDNQRRVSPERLGEHVAHTGFADGYPLLVASMTSLAALNARLAARTLPTIPMSRFRPNIVINGAPAFAEHDSETLTGEYLSLWLCKPCERCRITTINQSSGEIAVPGEPLKTLMTMDHVPGAGAFFGENAVIMEGAGQYLHTGMPVSMR